MTTGANGEGETRPDDNNDTGREFNALSSVVAALQALSPAARGRVLASVAAFFGASAQDYSLQHAGSRALETRPVSSTPGSRFSDDRTPSPKEFLFEKSPKTDVDRIACLGYYLTHYRDTPHFKTLELSKLNTEAAQLKFSNAAYAVDNAAKAGLIVPASKGSKQISALGERYVQALPDREAAKAVMADARPRKRTKKGSRAAADSDSDLEPQNN
jgi:hypothetical protein